MANDSDARRSTLSFPGEWVLYSPTPDCPILPIAITVAVQVGCNVERASTGRYRVVGPIESLNQLAEYIRVTLSAHPIGFGLETPTHDPAAPVQIVFTKHPDRPPARTAPVQGCQSHGPVAAAIDAGLKVRSLGVYRFECSGSTARHIAWMQAYLRKPRADVLQLLCLTGEAALAEDVAAGIVPNIHVTLPPRRTETTVSRNVGGDIVKSVSVETDFQQ
jgi:hypothetical protein